MPFISESVKNEILSAQDYCDEVLTHIDQANRMLDKFDFSRLVILPCHFGDRLWWCYDDDNDFPVVEESEPVKGILVKPGGECLATFDHECFDTIGGPYLFLTEAEARAEQTRRLLKQNKTQAEEMKEEKTDGSL